MMLIVENVFVCTQFLINFADRLIIRRENQIQNWENRIQNWEIGFKIGENQACSGIL